MRSKNEKLKTDLDHQNLIQDTVKTQNQELVTKQKKLEIKTKIYADKVHQLEEVSMEFHKKRRLRKSGIPCASKFPRSPKRSY